MSLKVDDFKKALAEARKRRDDVIFRFAHRPTVAEGTGPGVLSSMCEDVRNLQQLVDDAECRAAGAGKVPR